MTAIAAEVLDDSFFAPTPHTAIDSLLGQYQAMHQRICEVGALVNGERAGAVHYFLEAAYDERHRYSKTVADVFDVPRAVCALDADFWRRTIELTDLYSVMPQARRDEWNQALRERTCPPYTAETVQATLEELLGSRDQFLAERVDGIFRNLSRQHVTNRPEGFSRRLIVQAFDRYDLVCHSRAGYINDLRTIVARFMGRGEPRWDSSSAILKACRRSPGTWFPVDGGALRIRVYGVGTAHIEIHEQMAWRLNALLASLYPTAIPSQFRTKPPRPSRQFTLMDRPLPFPVLELLADLRGKGNERSIPYSTTDRAIRQEVRNVLLSLGALESEGAAPVFHFEFDPQPVLDQIIASGVIPDQRAHQFYPTPEPLAQRLVREAQIRDGHTVLEPSAGTGAIARHVPSTRLTCVEISEVHARALRAGGLDTHCADFLAWAPSAPRFERVVMNPPFSEGRALSHLQAAYSVLAPGGRLAAILPSSLRGKDVLPGVPVQWSEVIAGAFAGTSASVVIATAERAP
jgi:hypothetical protein